ncbi:MAG: hypothetical protein Q8S13_00815 [Dehalococcoidia bacterium]|nr:hypothetical protein [Dehalococcoidia bacterium]
MLAGVLFSTSIACGGDGGGHTPAIITGLLPTPGTTLAPGGDPGVTVLNVVLACREKDGERLRSFVEGPVTDQEIEALFALGTDLQLLSQTEPVVEDDRASVTVRLQVRRDAESEDVERVWELVRGDDGVWRFPTLPDCY